MVSDTAIVAGPAKPVAVRRAIPPRALVVSLYGLYAREAGGVLGIAALVRLMAAFGVDEQAVRSLISRLKQRGILHATRVGGAAGYGLSADAWGMLAEGDRRIFGRPRAQLADGWLLAVFSVPESERAKRHMLRSRLTWLGFGTVSAGVWIAPTHLHDEARDVLEHYRLARYVELFRGAQLAGDLTERVRTWWDLDSLAERYAEFLQCHRAILNHWRRGSRRFRSDDAGAFVDYVRTVTAWRRLPYLDPGLPIQVLPPGWQGTRAEELFRELADLLAVPAGRRFAALAGRPATG